MRGRMRVVIGGIGCRGGKMMRRVNREMRIGELKGCREKGVWKGGVMVLVWRELNGRGKVRVMSRGKSSGMEGLLNGGWI